MHDSVSDRGPLPGEPPRPDDLPPASPADLTPDASDRVRSEAGPSSADRLKAEFLEDIRRQHGEQWIKDNWERLEEEWEYIQTW
jgi:hypothetical protein